MKIVIDCLKKLKEVHGFEGICDIWIDENGVQSAKITYVSPVETLESPARVWLEMDNMDNLEYEVFVAKFVAACLEGL